MAITELTDTNFEEVVKKSNIPVIVDFYANWCKPCLKLVPTLEEIADEKNGELLVCKVDVDQSKKLAGAYQVMSIPSIISFKNGEMYKRVVGSVSKQDLLALVE